jgi:hypothetical protein
MLTAEESRRVTVALDGVLLSGDRRMQVVTAMHTAKHLGEMPLWVLALIAQSGWRGVESKTGRHVRDAEFWGAPVGTPLPLVGRGGVVSEARIPDVVLGQGATMGPPTLHRSDSVLSRLDNVSTESLIDAATPYGDSDSVFRHRFNGQQRARDDGNWPPMSNPSMFVIDATNTNQTRISYDPEHAVDGPRLDTPEGEHLARRTAVDALLLSWSVTANDHGIALGIQEGVQEEFGLESAESSRVLDTSSRMSDEVKASVPTYRALARAVYESTQEYLKANDIRAVTVTRGTREYGSSDELFGAMKVRLRPASSWTTDIEVAKRFGVPYTEDSESGVVMKASVLSKRVLSLAASGFGDKSEDEVVLLGGILDVEVVSRDDTDWLSQYGELNGVPIKIKRTRRGGVVSHADEPLPQLPDEPWYGWRRGDVSKDRGIDVTDGDAIVGLIHELLKPVYDSATGTFVDPPDDTDHGKVYDLSELTEEDIQKRAVIEWAKKTGVPMQTTDFEFVAAPDYYVGNELRDMAARWGMDEEDADAFTVGVEQRLRHRINRDNEWAGADEDVRRGIIDVVRDVRERGSVMVALDQMSMKRVLEDNRLKSQFETQSSHGTLAPFARAVQEVAVFDLHPSVDPTLRPIYGYIGTRSKTPTGLVSAYGDVRLLLNDHAKSRTTMTAGDSLNSQALPVPMTGEITDRQAFDAGHLERYRLIHGDGLKEIERDSYFEAQIARGVTFDEDVAAVYLPYDVSQIDETTRFPRSGTIQSLAEQLREASIPVRWYNGVTGVTEEDELGIDGDLYDAAHIGGEGKLTRGEYDTVYWQPPVGLPAGMGRGGEISKARKPPTFDDPVLAEINDSAEEIARLDDLRRIIGPDGRWANTKQGDYALARIVQMRGFDAKPDVVPTDEFDQLSNESGYITLYRGIKPSENGDAATFSDNLRNGEFYLGTGTLGNGMYATTSARTASTFALGMVGDGGIVVPMLVKPDARTIGLKELTKLQIAYFKSLGYKNVEDGWGDRWNNGDWLGFIAEDPGRFAAMMGYDVVVDSAYYPSDTIYLVLNRGALVVRDTDMTKEEADNDRG